MSCVPVFKTVVLALCWCVCVNAFVLLHVQLRERVPAASTGVPRALKAKPSMSVFLNTPIYMEICHHRLQSLSFQKSLM